MLFYIFFFLQVYLLEELVSPLLTPFLLCFTVRYKSQQIIDFYRNFTIEVTGVGDVCSFAQMDVRRHGHKMVSFVCECGSLNVEVQE